MNPFFVVFNNSVTNEFLGTEFSLVDMVGSWEVFLPLNNDRFLGLDHCEIHSVIEPTSEIIVCRHIRFDDKTKVTYDRTYNVTLKNEVFGLGAIPSVAYGPQGKKSLAWGNDNGLIILTWREACKYTIKTLR